MTGLALGLGISPVHPTHNPTAAAPTTPPAESDLALWLDVAINTYKDAAMTTPAVSNYDRISAWVDRSANGWELTQSDVSYSAKPLENYALTGLNVVNFGTNSFLNYPELLCNTFSCPSTWSFALLLIHGGAYSPLPFLYSQDNDKTIQLIPNPSFNTNLQVLNNQTHVPSAITYQTTNPLPAFVPHIVTGRVTGSDGVLRVNNTVEDTQTGAATNAWNGLTLGNTIILTDASITELLIWGTELTDDDLTLAYQYLANKYSL